LSRTTGESVIAELTVGGNDRRPVGVGRGARDRVVAGDDGLELVGAWSQLADGPHEERVRLMDLSAVPLGPVLVLEENDVSGGVGARSRPGTVEMLECQKAEDLGFLAEDRSECSGETNCFVDEIDTDKGIGGAREVPLVEDEVQDSEDDIDTVGKIHRDTQRNPCVADLAFRSDDPLCKGRFLDEEASCDLRGGESANKAQCERYLSVAIEAGVAAQQHES
jgi:hypothetical protein